MRTEFPMLKTILYFSTLLFWFESKMFAQVTIGRDEILFEKTANDLKLFLDENGLRFKKGPDQNNNGALISNRFKLELLTGPEQIGLDITSAKDLRLVAREDFTLFAENSMSFFFDDLNQAPLFITLDGTNRPRIRIHGLESNGQTGVLEITDDEVNHRMVFDGNEIDGMGGLVLNNNTDQNVHMATGGGLVGINTFSPSATLSVNGSANKIGGGSWSVFSDVRLKKNITPFTDGLEKILKIQPKRFQYNGTMTMAPDDGQQYIGVIAQEIRAVAPYMISPLTSPEECNEFLQYDGSALPYLLVNAVKSLHSQVQTLQMELKDVQKQLESSRQNR